MIASEYTYSHVCANTNANLSYLSMSLPLTVVIFQRI